MYKTGSLFEAIQIGVTSGLKIGLLIIDEEPNAAQEKESNTPGHVFQFPEPLIGADPGDAKSFLEFHGIEYIEESNVTACQQRLLKYMQSMNCFVCSINSQDFYCDEDPNYNATRLALKGLYNGHEYLVQKPSYNAFQDTSLHDELQKHKISHLAIMGWNINVCVYATIGAPPGHSLDHDFGDVGDGATHLGYKVMTCDQILHGGPAAWSANSPAFYSNVEFYSRFGRLPPYNN